MTVIAVTLWWLDLNQCFAVRSKGPTTELDTSPYYEASLPVTLAGEMQAARVESGGSAYFSDSGRDGGLWTGELVGENVSCGCSEHI